MPTPYELDEIDKVRLTPEEELAMVVPAADALMVRPRAMLAAVQAVSVARRGTVAWSRHDSEIAESCLGAFLYAVTTETGVVDRRRHKAALETIRQWCDAYPVEVFRELSHEQILAAGTALDKAGVDIGALHAHWARHLLGGVGDIAREALNDQPKS